MIDEFHVSCVCVNGQLEVQLHHFRLFFFLDGLERENISETKATAALAIASRRCRN
jgi:hypothetical protein